MFFFCLRSWTYFFMVMGCLRVFQSLFGEIVSVISFPLKKFVKKFNVKIFGGLVPYPAISC